MDGRDPRSKNGFLGNQVKHCGWGINCFESWTVRQTVVVGETQRYVDPSVDKGEAMGQEIELQY